MEYVQEGEDKLLRHSLRAVERASSLWDPVGYRLLDRTYCGKDIMQGTDDHIRDSDQSNWTKCGQCCTPGVTSRRKINSAHEPTHSEMEKTLPGKELSFLTAFDNGLKPSGAYLFLKCCQNSLH